MNIISRWKNRKTRKQLQEENEALRRKMEILDLNYAQRILPVRVEREEVKTIRATLNADFYSPMPPEEYRKKSYGINYAASCTKNLTIL